MQRSAFLKITDEPGRRVVLGLTAVSVVVLLAASTAAVLTPRPPARTAAQFDPALVAFVATPVTSLALVPSTTSTAAVASTPTLAPTTTSTTVAPTTTSTIPLYVIGNAGEFALPPGAKLPTEAQCAKRVHKAKETVPANTAANNTVPSALVSFDKNWGSNPKAAAALRRVTGKYKGTTDEIIQWASCKWGIDADSVRAQVMVESSWRQTATAGNSDDPAKCMPDVLPPCPTAFGLMQLRTDYQPGTYPWSSASTAFNLDYAMAMKRTCYDGNLFLGAKTEGDAWGCVGVHYSGKWRDDAATQYIDKVQKNYDKKNWPKR